MAEPRSVIVIGVSGSGKSSVGRTLADRWDDQFIEADDLHSAINVQKLASGIPLDDEDRLPWLRTVGERIRDDATANLPTVTACSALKRTYRDVLREYAPAAFFVELDGPFDLVRERVLSRHHEFMSSSLLESQYATLEPLELDEFGLRIDASLDVAEIADVVESALDVVSSDNAD
ncbi:MAG: gluconokinase [Acidimicrobiales bacterium]